MTTIDDTGELRQLAEQLRRMEHDPRRPGALDTLLLSISIGSAAVVCACLVILTFAADHFPVEPGRIVLTMAAAGTCVSPVLLGLYGLNSMNRKRFDTVMEKLDRLAYSMRCAPELADEIDPAFREAVKSAYRMGMGVRRNADDA